MTDPRYSGDIETSRTGGGGWTIGDPLRLSPLGLDVAVAVVVFAASVVNVAAQDEVAISEIPRCRVSPAGHWQRCSVLAAQLVPNRVGGCARNDGRLDGVRLSG